MKGRIVILISHRLNTLINADKIMVLKDGQVAEDGTHTTLMVRKNLYFNLYSSFQS